MQKLPQSFYARNTLVVAEELLGALLVHRIDGISRIGKIVEVEAYLGAHDLAAHSSKGVTRRTQVMFGPPGFSYVYLIYGIHHCMNVVTEPEGHGAAVLIRAIEPVQHVSGNTRGPGMLCKAMGIDLRLNGHDLQSDNLFIAAPIADEAFAIVRRARIGVAYAGEWAARPLRLYIESSRFISRK